MFTYFVFIFTIRVALGIADAADVHPEFRLMTAEVFALGICLLDDPFYEYKLLAESFTFKERTVTQ